MLSIYRRHTKGCPHRSEGRKYRRCRCPIWVDGFLGKSEIRKSTGLRDWEKAQALVRQWEAEGNVAEASPGPVTIEEAWEQFLHDAAARGLREPSLYKYRLLRRQMKTFAEAHGLRFVKEFDVVLCRKFRSSWPHQNLAALKTLERLRAFFRFCQESGWIAENPARKIKNPKVTQTPTMPYTKEEMTKVLTGCDDYARTYPKAGKGNAARLRALVLLFRYSGLRIRDAVTLSRDRIMGGEAISLYGQNRDSGVLPPARFCLAGSRSHPCH